MSSQPQATPVSPVSSPTPDADAGLRAACADALDELKAARKLIATQDAALGKDAELAGLQSQVETGLKNLRALDAEQKAELYKAVDAANREITALRSEVAVLKKQRMTFLKKVEYVLIGTAAGFIVRTVLKN